MAKFRVNHRRRRGASSSMILRLGLFTFFLLALLFLPKAIRSSWNLLEVPALLPGERYFLPATDSASIQQEKYFSYYWPKEARVRWVAYRLVPQMLNRSGKAIGPPGYYSWLPVSEFGFDKDLKLPFQPIAISTTLDQAALDFNRRIWKSAREAGAVFVTRGLVLDSIGRETALFTTALTLEAEPQKMLAQYLDLQADTAGWTPVDSLEVRLNLDLYHEFMPSSLEDSLEATFRPESWPLPGESGGR